MARTLSKGLSKNFRLILVCFLLVGAILRIYGLNNLSPPGLEHDEVAHWLINRDIAAGNHSIYFTEAYGHEAGFHYVQTLFMVLMGGNAFILRLPSAFAGLLLIAISFSLSRRLFGKESALLSAGLLAVLFWPVFYSRLALRAIALPLVTAFSAYFWWRAWQEGENKAGPTAHNIPVQSRITELTTNRSLLLSSNLIWYALAGIMAGLSLYVYMASRVLPIFFLIFFGCLFLIHRDAFLNQWRGIALFIVLFAIVSVPMVVYLIAHPGIESRISEVNQPLIALAGGQLKPVLNNAIKSIGMFGVRGDPLWRQNVANLPVFDPFVALFFYIGLAISLWKWREPAYLFIILWLFTSTIPSIVTIDAPSSIRIINALPFITLFPVIGLKVINNFRTLSTISTKLSTDFGVKSILFVCVGVFVFNSFRTADAIYRIWPANGEIQFVWQKALTQIADYLDRNPGLKQVAIGGWSPDTMDPPTMELSLERDDLNLRYFDPNNSLIVPEVADTAAGSPVAIMHPSALPIQPLLTDRLAAWADRVEVIGEFTILQGTQPFSIDPQVPHDVSFGDEITFLGYDLMEQPQAGTVGATLDLLTYWQVKSNPQQPRRFFLHLVEENGAIIAQADLLGAPATHWSTGDVIIQLLSLTDSEGHQEAMLRLGVYNPETGLRILTDEGQEFVVLEDMPGYIQ